MSLFEKWDKVNEGGLKRVVQNSLGPGTCAEFLECYARALEDIQARVRSIPGRFELSIWCHVWGSEANVFV